MTSAVVECDRIWFGYNENPVLRGVSLRVEQGQFAGIIGANGSGKSTLLRILLGLLQPQQGRLMLLGATPVDATRSGRIGYVPQKETFRRDFPLTVEDVVLMGRAGRIGLGRRPCRHDREKALSALQQFGLEPLRKRSFGALSGGQQRLVLLARAIAQEPELLIMDEADTGLDEVRRRLIYQQLAVRRAETGLTVVAVSHQLDLLAEVVGEAFALQDGMCVEWCPSCMHHAIGAQQPSHLGTVT